MYDLLELEERGWRALSTTRHAARAFYRTLLVDEAVMMFPEGTMVVGKEKILGSIDAQPWKILQIEAPRSNTLSQEVRALFYKVTTTWDERAPSYVALISSLYVHREGAWKLALHQQTPV
jgi:hypothetical protein